MERRLPLRQIGIALLVVFCSALGSTAPCLGQGVPGATVDDEWGPKDRDLPGTWLLAVEFPGFPAFRFLMTVDPDGTSTVTLPDHHSFFSDTRSACVGPWKRTGARTYQMTLYCLQSQDMDGVFNRGRFNVTLSKDGKTISDPSFKQEWWLGHPSDGVYLGYGLGSFVGERMPNVPKD
jgi:hypothetical protein